MFSQEQAQLCRTFKMQMEKTRETESSMRTDWDTPERTKLLAYSIAYRFKALCWRKQTREKFLGMERRFQSLLQPTK